MNMYECKIIVLPVSMQDYSSQTHKVVQIPAPSFKIRITYCLQLKLNHQQDHQALIKAKYCPKVAAASCTRTTPKAHVTLTFNP